MFKKLFFIALLPITLLLFTNCEGNLTNVEQQFAIDQTSSNTDNAKRPTVYLRGRVYDTNGNPVAYATVEIRDANGTLQYYDPDSPMRTTTNAYGYYGYDEKFGVGILQPEITWYVHAQKFLYEGENTFIIPEIDPPEYIYRNINFGYAQ